MASANEEEGATDVPVLRIDLGDIASDEASNKDLQRITFVYTGDNTADVPATGVKLYYDSDNGGAFDVGDRLVATGVSWNVMDITLIIPDTIIYPLADTELDNDIDAAEESYFLLIDIADLFGAGVTRTVGLQVAGESADILFYDSIDDNIEGTSAGIGSATFEYDQSGYISTSAGLSSSTITIDAKSAPDVTPPTVALTIPDNTETGISRDAIFTVAFSEEMTLVVPADVTISGSISGSINPATDGTFTFNTTTNQSFTFQKTTSYEYIETVTVTVNNTVTDVAAAPNAMASDYVFSFDIELESFPTVQATSPSDGNTDVSSASLISITFSEAMVETTVLDEGNFSLAAAGAAEEVAGVMTYSAGANTATFTPDEALSFSTEYTATATTGMTDEEGSALAADYVFTFTTVSAAGSLQFSGIIVANNRITSETTDPMRIFVELPSTAGATETVVIQVYTSSGRRVATLTDPGETYADVIARQPILWDGTNDRGQDLGPGLYFIQVSSTGNRETRRVMIVR